MLPALRRVTELDGPERFCRRCAEWWPDDAEFWFRHGTPKQQCRACMREWNRLSYEKRRAVA